MGDITSRERVRLSLAHKEPDKVPIDFGAMRSTGIHVKAYSRLRNYLGLDDGCFKLYDITQQLAEPERKIIKKMGADVVQLHRYKPSFGIPLNRWKKTTIMFDLDCLVPYEFEPIQRGDGSLVIKNDKGEILGKMPEDGYYFDQVSYKNINTKEDIDNIYRENITEEELDYLKQEAKKLYNETEYAILGEFGGNIVETGNSEWGMVNYLTNLAAEPELMHYYHSKLSEFHLNNLKKYLHTVGEYIDIIQFGDDLGIQDNSLISRAMYKEMIKPYHSKLYQYVRNNYPDVKVFLHSCGSIYNLLPDLIEAGVEIVNPVQLSAANMNPKNLKRQFGKYLVFWGGGIDTQTTLSNGTINDIKNEVREMIDIFSPGGGYVFTQVHNIQANISPEKVMAVYETAKKNRCYI